MRQFSDRLAVSNAEWCDAEAAAIGVVEAASAESAAVADRGMGDQAELTEGRRIGSGWRGSC